VKAALMLLALTCFAGLPGFSATLEITIKDAKGESVEDAVVWAMPRPGPAPVRKRDAAVAQKDKTFIPFVTVVQTGTAVQFPNQDPIRHHVYSFSPAKVFEIKLYAGTPVAPIVFDKPGEVVLGCNIHDHMLAYIYVVDTPYFAKTGKEGRARLESLPAGDYELLMWHFAQAAPVASQAVRLRGDESAPAGFVVTLAPVPPRPPAQ
jgi:plastocyanin